MKTFLGIFLSLIIFAGATITILALWGITPIEWTHIWKTGLTIAIVFVTSLIIWLIKIMFLSKDPFNVHKRSKNSID